MWVNNSTQHSVRVYFECMDSSPGNLLVASIVVFRTLLLFPLNCWILWKVKKSWASSELVTLNHALMEMASDASLVGFLAGSLLADEPLILASSYMCSTFLLGRPLLQTFFCVERYLAVVHPLLYRLHLGQRRTLKLAVVGVVWVATLSSGWYLVSSYPRMPILLFMGLYVCVMAVCTSCSLRILWVLKKPGPGEREQERAYQQKKKAFASISVILLAFLTGYGAVTVVILMREDFAYRLYCLLLGVGWWMLLPSGVVQPYLYLSRGKRVCVCA